MIKQRYIFSICITLLSFLTVFYEWFVGEIIIDWLLFAGIIILWIFHLRFFKLYNYILGYKNAGVTKGLFISAVIGFIALFSFIIWSIANYYVGINDLYYSIIFPLHLSLAIICFLVDIFNNETKKIKKIRIFFGSISFYLGNLILLIGLWVALLVITFVRDLA